jgi:F0F1-type ATP synthase epsilon subunit
MTQKGLTFNPPPGWPRPPDGWVPPRGWTPDPAWPPPPVGWQLWVSAISVESTSDSPGKPDGLTVPVAAPAASMSAADRITLLEAENAALRVQLRAVGTDASTVVELNDERVLQDVGIYRYHHPLENAVAYRQRLDDVGARIAQMVQAGAAIEKSNMFTFDGSLAKGRTFANDLSKLMLRAYNAEAENVVRTLRAGNLQTAVKRLEASRAAIARLGKMMEMRIGDGFHALRVEELELTADYLIKKEEEREAARAERERLREERKVEQELAAARERLEKERAHLLTVIATLKENGSSDPALEQQLASVDNAIVQNDYRAANIRAGYVYVISNRGALGEHVVKIGLTRRLEPLDRINELGDASVPFKFDVHAIYFSEDAVKLENELHDHFASRRLNWANNRKEFFFASPLEVRSVLTEKVGNLLVFAENCESSEYHQSVSYWPEEFRRL